MEKNSIFYIYDIQMGAYNQLEKYILLHVYAYMHSHVQKHMNRC